MLEKEENKSKTNPPVKAKSEIEPIVFLEKEEEDIDSLYEESVKGFHDQDIVSGTITEITRDYVTVDICFKSDCLIAVNEFQNSEGLLEVEVGDTVDVYVNVMNSFDESECLTMTSFNRSIAFSFSPFENSF